MNLSIVIAVGLLCSAASGYTFKWDPLVNVSDAYIKDGAEYQTSADGSMHFFWQNESYGNTLYYQILFPDNTFVTKSILKPPFEKGRFDSISAQVSDDGKHLLVAYIGEEFKYDCSDFYNNPCQKAYFIESLDGGESWSAPIAMDHIKKDYHAHSKPVVLLEKSTGRVYISYTVRKPFTTNGYRPKIAFREVREKVFRDISLEYSEFDSLETAIGLTVDKENSKRYLHLLMWGKDGYGNKEINYTYSDDNGQSWKPRTILGSYLDIYSSNAMVTDPQVNEGVVYLQFMTGNAASEKLVHRESRDNENRFRRGVELDGKIKQKYKQILCGSNGTGILLSTYYKDKQESVYVAFMPFGSQEFKELPEPFEDMKDTFNYIGAKCTYLGNSQYLITLVAEVYSKNCIYVLRGKLDLANHFTY